MASRRTDGFDAHEIVLPTSEDAAAHSVSEVGAW